MTQELLTSLFGDIGYRTIVVIYYLYPIWLPIILGSIFWILWVRYVRYLYFSTTPYTLLEIRMPQETNKSPLAMEVVLSSLYQVGLEGTVFDRYWKGQTRAWYALEIVSLGGDVRFLMWTRQNMRNVVEAQIYSQYPEVEIREVEDYTKNVAFDLDTYDFWAANYILLQPDTLPIKTYIDYGLDRDPKEEYKVDPLAAMIELLGTAKPQEQMWFQIVIRAHKKEKQSLFGKKTDWTSQAKDVIRAIRLDKSPDSLTSDDMKKDLPPFNAITKEAQDRIAALERNVAKLAFDTGIRGIYISPKNAYDRAKVTTMRSLLNSFNSPTRNGFKQDYLTNFTDYPWDDVMDLRVNYRKRIHLDAYKRRMFFYEPYIFKKHVMSIEALATLYHFPGSVAKAPGLVRIPSKKAQAPGNLPI